MLRAICLGLVLVLVGGAAADMTYSTVQDGVSVTWISVPNEGGTTATHTWQVGGPTVVIGTLGLADPLAPTWEGTLNGQAAHGSLLLFVEGEPTTTIGILLLDSTGATLSFFKASNKVVGAMIPEFKIDPTPIDERKCVCWPIHEGNGRCRGEDCDDGMVDCNSSTGAKCNWRNMHVVPT